VSQVSLRSRRQPHHVVALVEPGEEAGDVGRVVLEVAVHWHDHAAASGVEPCGEGGGLAVVAPQADDLHPRVGGLDGPQPVERVVGAAVVDEEDFGVGAHLVERGGELGMERLDVVGLVEHRDDDGELGARRLGRLAAGRFARGACHGVGSHGPRGIAVTGRARAGGRGSLGRRRRRRRA